MPDHTLYGSWEPSRPDLIRRSYLYPLAPIGVGTAAVESLTGYISRLAAAHAVETGTLVNRELLPRVPYTKGDGAGQVPKQLPKYSFYIDAYTLNGAGHRARLWASLLEQLTCVPRLNLLTTLPWSNVISCNHLLRTNRVWCPSCYGDEGSSAQSYERLSWAFQMVMVCPNHRRQLESVCPFCGRKQYVFSARSRPGYCSRCYGWLGGEPQATTSDSDLTEQITVAEMVGELLAAGATLPAHFGLDRFRENVCTFIRDAGGYYQFRAGLHPHRVRGWIQFAHIPRMDALVTLARNQDVTVIRLLTERINSGKKADQNGISKSHYRVPTSAVEAALQAALQLAVPSALQQIANQLGYRTVSSLQCRFPALCCEIAERRRSEIRTSRLVRRKRVPRDRIEKALIEELSKPGFTNLRAVAASVGLSSKRRFYKDFRDLRQAIVAKNATVRKRRAETIRSTLGAAFNEQPVPTIREVARRLGYATVNPLTSRFPQLTMDLRACRRLALHTSTIGSEQT